MKAIICIAILIALFLGGVARGEEYFILNGRCYESGVSGHAPIEVNCDDFVSNSAETYRKKLTDRAKRNREIVTDALDLIEGLPKGPMPIPNPIPIYPKRDLR